jgi:hypothetical protein
VQRRSAIAPGRPEHGGHRRGPSCSVPLALSEPDVRGLIGSYFGPVPAARQRRHASRQRRIVPHPTVGRGRRSRADRARWVMFSRREFLSDRSWTGWQDSETTAAHLPDSRRIDSNGLARKSSLQVHSRHSPARPGPLQRQSCDHFRIAIDEADVEPHRPRTD